METDRINQWMAALGIALMIAVGVLVVMVTFAVDDICDKIERHGLRYYIERIWEGEGR